MGDIGDHLRRHEESKRHQVVDADSFYSKLNEVIVSKFNLGEKTENSKIERKILRSLSESFRAKVTAIEESKDLDDIKVQELVGSLQTYEMSLAINGRVNLLLLRPLMRRWKTMTHRKKMWLTKMLHIL